MEYAELLKRLTVDCKDDGKQFRKKDRIHEIKALLENSGYELLGEGSLSLLYGKPMEEENIPTLPERLMQNGSRPYGQVVNHPT